MVARIRNAHAIWQAILAALAVVSASSVTTDLLGSQATPILSLILACANVSTAAYYAALARRNDTTLADLMASQRFWRERALGPPPPGAIWPPDPPRNTQPPGQTPGG